jgi:hypothetical protein
MKTFKFLLIALIGASLIFTSCDDDNGTPEVEEGTVSMMFEYKVGEENFETSKVYNIGGTAVEFVVANFYVSSIVLMPEPDSGKEPINVEGKYLLVTPDAGAQELLTIETGHIHEAKFNIGIDPETNNQSTEDFTNRPADDPLSLQDPPMSWNWNTGYRFVRIDGLVDADGDGTPEEVMEFHLGLDDFLTELEYTVHEDVEKGGNMLHFQFDLAKLFDGIDLSTEYQTHTFDNMELATKFRDNLSAAISKAH